MSLLLPCILTWLQFIQWWFLFREFKHVLLQFAALFFLLLTFVWVANQHEAHRHQCALAFYMRTY